MILSTTRQAMLGAALGVALALPVPAGAQVWRDCREKIELTHHRLELALARYGNDSRQARRRQQDYNDVRLWCWREYKGWWDERYGRWRTDRFY